MNSISNGTNQNQIPPETKVQKEGLLLQRMLLVQLDNNDNFLNLMTVLWLSKRVSLFIGNAKYFRHLVFRVDGASGSSQMAQGEK